MNIDLSKIIIETNIEINAYDIDIAGHVNNIVFIRWLEDLRNKLFSAICPLEKLLENNFYLVVISTEVKYKKQVRLFDKPHGIMYLENVSHGVFVFKAQIVLKNKIIFEATQRGVLMNLCSGTMYSGKISDFISSIK